MRLGCNASVGFPAQLACLRAAPVDALLKAAVATAGTNFLPLTLGPVIDGALVTASPAAAILRGEFNTAATVLVSETLFEGDGLLDGFTHSVVLTPQQSAAALVQFGVQVGFSDATTAAVGKAYEGIAARDGYFNCSTRIWGDGLISCAAAWASRGAAAHSLKPTYRLLYNTSFGNQPAGRATHGTDMGIVFGNALPPISADIAVWFANVACTGDPNQGPAGTASTPWIPFTATNAKDMLVVNEKHVYSHQSSWQEELCDSLWLPILP